MYDLFNNKQSFIDDKNYIFSVKNLTCLIYLKNRALHLKEINIV